MTHEVSFEALHRDVIMEVRKTVAGDFDSWLARFIAGTLDTEPNFPKS